MKAPRPSSGAMSFIMAMRSPEEKPFPTPHATAPPRSVDHVSCASSTCSHKKFYKFRTTNNEKGNACLTCNSFGKQGFTRTWRTNQQNPFGDSCTDVGIALRCF